MKKTFLLFAFCCSILTAKEPDVYLVTYAKSGTNWMMYCMTELTGRGWRPQGGGSYAPAEARVDTSLKRFQHAHLARAIQNKMNPNEDLLILLLRNYKECWLRTKDVDSRLSGLSRENYYFENLQFFDSWDPEKRLLIYYEDFMQYPEETLEKVMAFVERPDKTRLKQFIQKLPMHREKVLHFYQRNRCGGKSQGKDLLYHSKKFDEEKLSQLDDYIQGKFPNLFEKYLWMYAQ